MLPQVYEIRMDFNKFDNGAEGTTEEDYSAFVEWLSALTAAELQQAAGDLAMQKQILCRYYKRGERANLTPGELIDFLSVSAPSIMDWAGYSEAEQDALMQISDNLTDAEIASASLSDNGASTEQFAIRI